MSETCSIGDPPVDGFPAIYLRRCFRAVLILLSTERLGLVQRRAYRSQPFQRAQDLRLIIGQVAHRDVGVSDCREAPKLFRDLVDRPRDQGFGRHAAIASAQRMLQYRLCLGRRLADIDVTPQDDGPWLSAVSGAALTIQIGLRAGLLAGEAGARDPALG